MKMLGLSACAIGALLLVGCSDDPTAEEEVAQIEAGREAAQAAEDTPSVQSQYDAAVGCAATAVNVANVFNVIASTDEDSNPEQAAQARGNAEQNMTEARAFAQQAEQIARDPQIGKTRDEVMADIDGIDRVIRERGRNADDFMAFATELARESDQCDTIQNPAG
ncbi:hypothetical protein [Parasphingopyxis lamellibrachiae]|uniref:Lipoprotein n=1 Tax=Parasphingopyxis lamellibrachiae TaxID=680125 RepID=A0A3D9FCT5_9SPHN|nr:hypothetical protein [Parasphingopyxis lamellibrachiae]RED15624.1 hypothetical protein DFR46_0622 [Parasphingopyxis lamellibrachiae]